jgi:hypothetical protein
MRYILLATLFSLGPAASVQTATPEQPDADQQIAGLIGIVCEPPQVVKLSKQVNRRVCVQKDILANLREKSPALEVAARSPVKFMREDKLSSDPSAVTCQQTIAEAFSRLSRPRLNCAHNSYRLAEAREPKTYHPVDLQQYNGQFAH